MRPLRAALLSVVASAALLVPPGSAAAAFDDVPEGHWAHRAIRYVAAKRTWMRDFGSSFRPDEPIRRRHLARALIRAFAPNAEPGPTFTDLPTDDAFFPAASAAVRKKWMKAPDDAFDPDGTVTKRDLARAVVRALKLRKEVRGLSRIRTSDGARLAVPPEFGSLILAQQLRLHTNHPTSAEGRELLPGSAVSRAHAADSLHRAATTPSWRLEALRPYRKVVLKAVDPERRAAVTFALAQAGMPYVYAGEWAEPTPGGYCCGDQAQGGLDCSGFVWWVMREGDALWDNTSHRGYEGWPLPERSSREMARATPAERSFRKSRPLDLMFFDGDDSHKSWRGVDHVGLYLGRGWMIHSASGVNGVTLEKVRKGWYRDHFRWSRRLIP